MLELFCSVVESLDQATDSVPPADSGHGPRLTALVGQLCVAAVGKAGALASVRPAVAAATTAALAAAPGVFENTGAASPQAAPAETTARGKVTRDLQCCPYGALKAVCGEVSGYGPTWQALLQPPSLFACWIPKPQELQCFCAQ